MQTDTLWLRLPINWDKAKWIRGLPRNVRYAWLDVVRYVRMVNPTGWTVDFIDAECLAQDLGSPELGDTIKACLEAALRAGVVRIEGDYLRIVECEQFMSPDTLRKRELRKTNHPEDSGEPNDSQDCPGHSGTVRDTAGLSALEENRREEKKKEENVSSQKSRFEIPSVDEVKGYMIERSWKEPQTLSQKFVDHYTANGWMVGRTKMKDWKAAVRKWEEPDKIAPAQEETKEADLPDSVKKVVAGRGW